MQKKHVFIAALFTFGLAVVALVAPLPALADSYQVFVGYADNLRPSPFFPNPWSGDPNVQYFLGGGTFDAGVVGIFNNGPGTINLENLSVAVPTWTGNGTANTSSTGIWSGFSSFGLTPGKWAIFTQTSSYNFDTSDFGLASPPLNSTSNCDPGNPFAIANPATCAAIAPTVSVTVAGTLTSFTDSAQVLDTGGFDFVNADPCPVPGDTPGNCNESLQWRLIGTTGISNPNGVPEPSALLLLGSGLAGLAGLAWRKN